MLNTSVNILNNVIQEWDSLERQSGSDAEGMPDVSTIFCSVKLQLFPQIPGMEVLQFQEGSVRRGRFVLAKGFDDAK